LVEDDSADGFNNWPFTTVHNWGESPRGVWTLEIVDVENNGNINYELLLKIMCFFF
jgi:subtilisin-like proprotein convertase family protein